MSGVSISDVRRKFCGAEFTLRASQEAYAQIEAELNASYVTVLTRLQQPIPRLTDVTAVFAALALPHGKHSGKSIRALMPAVDGGASLIEARNAIDAALQAAAPKKGDVQGDGIAGGEGDKSDPQ